MEKEDVSMFRLAYFKLATGRSPSPLETLQNNGIVKVSAEELKALQSHQRTNR